MRGFQRTAAKQALYTQVVRATAKRVQVIWGADDPALKLSVYGEQARRVAGVETIYAVPGRHFLPEDQAPALAGRIAGLAETVR